MDSDYIFIKEPDDVLKCCICLDIARNPKQEEGCGKLFVVTALKNGRRIVLTVGLEKLVFLFF